MKKYILLLLLFILPLLGWAQGASPSNMKLFPFKNDSMYTWPPVPNHQDSTIYVNYEEMVAEMIGEGISTYFNEDISMFGGSLAKHLTLVNGIPYYTVFYFCKFAFDGSSDRYRFRLGTQYWAYLALY